MKPAAPVAAAVVPPVEPPVRADARQLRQQHLRTTAGPDAAELEKFLINFVVEQTGYPPEVVELDADLEADLGIDSIKKAQLFGELAEYFDVQPNENLTLDDFPTLRHVLNFLAAAPAKTDLASPSAPAAVVKPAAPVAAAGGPRVEAPVRAERQLRQQHLRRPLAQMPRSWRSF